MKELTMLPSTPPIRTDTISPQPNSVAEDNDNCPAPYVQAVPGYVDTIDDQTSEAWFRKEISRPGGLEKIVRGNLPHLRTHTTSLTAFTSCLESKNVLHDWSRSNSAKAEHNQYGKIYKEVIKKDMGPQLVEAWKESGNNHIFRQLMDKEKTHAAKAYPAKSMRVGASSKHQAGEVVPSHQNDGPEVEFTALDMSSATMGEDGTNPNSVMEKTVTAPTMTPSSLSINKEKPLVEQASAQETDRSSCPCESRRCSFRGHTVLLLLIVAILVVYILLVRLYQKNSMDGDHDDNDEDNSNGTTTSTPNPFE